MPLSLPTLKSLFSPGVTWAAWQVALVREGATMTCDCWSWAELVPDVTSFIFLQVVLLL